MRLPNSAIPAHKFYKAAPGLEPGVRVLQTHALPLGDRATVFQNYYDGKDRLDSLLATPARDEDLSLGALARRHSPESGCAQVHDRCTDQVAPLGPGAVIVADPVVADQVFQDKPGV